MAAYVNKLRTRYGSLRFCHLLADSQDELHAMALKLGMDRRNFQTDGIPHYDLSLAKRDSAIAAGAQVIGRAQLLQLVRRFRG
jgi:hypothetical protein